MHKVGQLVIGFNSESDTTVLYNKKQPHMQTLAY